MKKFLALEPALVRGVIVAVISLLAGLGFTISGATSEAIVTLVTAALAIAQAVSTRGKVTPANKADSNL